VEKFFAQERFKEEIGPRFYLGEKGNSFLSGGLLEGSHSSDVTNIRIWANNHFSKKQIWKIKKIMKGNILCPFTLVINLSYFPYQSKRH